MKTRRNPHGPSGHFAQLPIRSGNIRVVRFGDPVLSNFLDGLRSLTGGTHFATFYLTFIQTLAE
jgi:hypothetical protein